MKVSANKISAIGPQNGEIRGAWFFVALIKFCKAIIALIFAVVNGITAFFAVLSF